MHVSSNPSDGYDDDNGNGNSIMDSTLVKCTGLHYIIHPDTVKIHGQNAFHVLFMVLVAYTVVGLSLYPIGLYLWANDTTQLTLQITAYGNFLFGAYKGMTIVRRSADIWKCVDVARIGFVRPPGDDEDAAAAGRRLRACRDVSAAFTRWFAVFNYCILMLWSVLPLAMSSTHIEVRNLDGTFSSYRFNPFNMYFFVSAATYNRWHRAFHVLEWLYGLSFVSSMVLFDTFMVTMCVAIRGQLRVVDAAFRRLGHDRRRRRRKGVTESASTNSSFEDLKLTVISHQKVLRKMNDFYKIVRPVILPQLMVASLTIVTLSFSITLNYFNGTLLTSTQTLKFCSFPTFLFQLYYTCLVFGNLNDQEDVMHFAMYSSNWTQMEIKSKKLLLLAMRMHSSNKLNMKITNKLVVNLELFARVINMSYSIFSVLVKSQLKLKNIQ